MSISISGLAFSYGPGSHQLHDVSLSVAEAELCCLLGPNGAGKTTLIRCVLGLLRPDAGSLMVAGRDVASLSARQLARLVAYVPQNTTTVFPFTALEMVTMGRTPHLATLGAPSRSDRTVAMSTLEGLGAGHFAHRPFQRLSGGERQLTMLARALAQEASVLILDEPTGALDYGNEVRILQAISELVTRGATVLMTTHQPNHALTWAHHAALIDAGRVIAAGPPAQIITSIQLTSLYNVPVQVIALPAHPGRPEQFFCLPDITPPEPQHTPHASSAQGEPT